MKFATSSLFFCFLVVFFFLFVLQPPPWSSDVRLESGIPGVKFPLAPGIFSGSNHTSDLKMGTQVATLPGAWRNRVSTGTGWPGVSML